VGGPIRRLKRKLGEVRDDLEPRRREYRGGGLHSSTFRLNLSALCGIGGALRGCPWGVGGYSGCLGCFFVLEGAQVELRS